MAEIRGMPPKKNGTKINRFGGVDFTSNNTKMEPWRSPDAVNMIADELFLPCKRTGYHKVIPEALEGKVNGMYKYVAPDEQTVHLLAHIGTKLYEFYPDGSEEREILGGFVTIADHSSIAFNFGGKLYILDGTKYLVYTGGDYYGEAASLFAPETYIGLAPAGTGGTEYEARNMLSSHVRNTFNGNGSATAYVLKEKVADDTYVEVWVNGVEKEKTVAYTFSVNGSGVGTVTFLSGHIPPAGEGNVTIRFAADPLPGQEEEYNKIMGCTIYSVFGGKNDTRIFLSGNPKYRNKDWMSGLYDPTYFPVDGYTQVGSESTAIVGYTRQYDTQIVIKEDNDVDATQYLRTFSLDDNGEPVYALQQGAQGAGAIAPLSFATLGDVPMFLSRSGVHGVMGTSVALQRSIMPKSTLINNRLLREENLQGAVAVTFDNKYYLAVNGHCYVADGNQRYNAAGGGVQYEWYYWENIPATSFLEHDGNLFFGTADGRVCRFYKNDEAGAYQDDGEAIACRWATPYLDFDNNAIFKTIRALYVTVKPYAHSTLEVYYATESKKPKLIFSDTVNVFDFNHINFAQFTFFTAFNTAPLAIKKQIKKVKTVQFIFANNGQYEFLGLAGMQIFAKEGSFIKNKR